MRMIFWVLVLALAGCGQETLTREGASAEQAHQRRANGLYSDTLEATLVVANPHIA